MFLGQALKTPSARLMMELRARLQPPPHYLPLLHPFPQTRVNQQNDVKDCDCYNVI
jgi:hypothetical protein